MKTSQALTILYKRAAVQPCICLAMHYYYYFNNPKCFIDVFLHYFRQITNANLSPLSQSGKNEGMIRPTKQNVLTRHVIWHVQIWTYVFVVGCKQGNFRNGSSACWEPWVYPYSCTSVDGATSKASVATSYERENACPLHPGRTGRKR
jgi:hypothetical protein